MMRRLLAVDSSRTAIRQLPAVLGLLAITGCSAGGSEGGPGTTGVAPIDPVPGAGGDGGSGVAAGGGAAPVGPGPVDAIPPGACIPDVQARVVRLTTTQLVNSVTALLGSEAQTAMAATNQLPADPEFFELQSSQEGTDFTSNTFRRTLTLTQAAAGTILTRFAEVTGCPALADDACAQAFLASFAERAYRRPLAPEELTAVQDFYTTLRAAPMLSTVEEATVAGVEGILVAPQVLYRQEFGAALPAPGTLAALSPYERANQLSYFLSDAPPDAALLAAAADGSLATPEGARAQADRLVASAPVQANLVEAMLSYYGLSLIFNDIKDVDLFPEYNAGLQNSMFRETELFLQNVLWAPGNTVNSQLLSNNTFVNQTLAPIYGIPYPGNPTDALDVFPAVTLPADQRAGLLTQAGYLAVHSRTTNTSVVFRGIAILGNVLCQQAPPVPMDPAIMAQITALGNNTVLTEREKYDVRAETQPCGSCHAIFDPFGLTLENYDPIGRYRETYPGNVPIDASVMLPASAGGSVVTNALQVAQAVADSGVFGRCLTQQLLRYALTESALVSSSSCGVEQVYGRFAATDLSFSSLLKEVAVSETLGLRSGGMP